MPADKLGTCTNVTAVGEEVRRGPLGRGGRFGFLDVGADCLRNGEGFLERASACPKPTSAASFGVDGPEPYQTPRIFLAL